jgi:hypothetical protein
VFGLLAVVIPSHPVLVCHAQDSRAFQNFKTNMKQVRDINTDETKTFW